jgi:hypothetical protein
MDVKGSADLRNALQLLSDVSRMRGDKRFDGWRREHRGEIEAAALAVLRSAQSELKEHVGYRPGNGLERSALVRIHQTIELALSAVARGDDGRPGRRSKQLQLEASDGEPAAICIGRRRFPNQLNGDGCGVVFYDVAHKRGAWFNSYCAECRRTERQRRALAQAEKVREREGPRPALLWRHDGRRLFHVRCACGRYFFTTDSRRTTCTTCHYRHR